jgi:predicted RNA-binding Zn-ribbon protein involved in translation (DUF1610 family)
LRPIPAPGAEGAAKREFSLVTPVKDKGSSDVGRCQAWRIDMKINCLSCGFKVDLDETYDDFEGPIKCLCGALLEIRIEEGMLKAIKMGEPRSRTVPKPKRMEGAAIT